MRGEKKKRGTKLAGKDLRPDRYVGQIHARRSQKDDRRCWRESRRLCQQEDRLCRRRFRRRLKARQSQGTEGSGNRRKRNGGVAVLIHPFEQELSMAKTKTAAAMDELQSHIRPFFEQRGYRLRARTFNRGTSDGLVHVLNFQMGQTSLQGKFTVNVGVYVPEVARVEYGPNERSFVQEPECCVRHRLGTLGPEHRDLWWDLLPNGPSAASLQLRLERDALPFLARFETRDSVFQELLD